MFLQTDRLVLRKIQEADFADFCEFAADPEACRMMGRDVITDAATARPTFDWLLNREDRAYVLVSRENGKVIGNLTVYNTVPPYLSNLDILQGKKVRSLSFSIGKPYRRQGLMYEAVSQVIDCIFAAENADCILYGYFDFNISSRKLQKKLGFQQIYTDSIQINGEQVVCMENVLWKELWKPLQKP